MSIAELAETGLPFNRKERFFTGTVLPMLVCAEDFAHFGRLTELVGLGRIAVDPRLASADIQFFTEYGFAESVSSDVDRARFPGAPTSKDTHDVQLYSPAPGGRGSRSKPRSTTDPRPSSWNEQLAMQAALGRYIAGRLKVEAASIARVALPPAALASKLGTLSVTTCRHGGFQNPFGSSTPARRALLWIRRDQAKNVTRSRAWGRPGGVRGRSSDATGCDPTGRLATAGV